MLPSSLELLPMLRSGFNVSLQPVLQQSANAASAQKQRFVVPPLPPNPGNWGTGPLQGSICRGTYAPERLQRCADQDPYHILPGEFGRHVFAVQFLLIFILGYSNPGFWADLRKPRIGVSRWREPETDLEIFSRWLRPIELSLGPEYNIKGTTGRYGPQTQFLIQQWKDTHYIRRPGQTVSERVITGKQTIRSLDYYDHNFVRKFNDQLKINNLEPWI